MIGHAIYCIGIPTDKYYFKFWYQMIYLFLMFGHNEL